MRLEIHELFPLKCPYYSLNCNALLNPVHIENLCYIITERLRSIPVIDPDNKLKIDGEWIDRRTITPQATVDMLGFKPEVKRSRA